MATMFNSIRMSRQLEEAGAQKPLADAIASMLGDTLGQSREDLVTKDYLKAELAQLRSELRIEIADVKSDMIRWLIGSQVSLFGALAVLIHFAKMLA